MKTVIEAKTIAVPVPTPDLGYNIYIKQEIGNELIKFILNLNTLPSSLFIISDHNVLGFYRNMIESLFIKTGLPFHIIPIPAGERSKSLDEVKDLYGELMEKGIDRHSVIIPFGGGVVGDLGGLVASTILRGIRYIHFPTSIIAQVDSSIGGKVGVDTPWGKNLVGSFYQPLGVFTDPSLIQTLPHQEFYNGMAEVIKSAVISSADLFETLDSTWGSRADFQPDFMERIIRDTARIKVDIVSRDPFETGERAFLNLGHTIGHALERLYKYENFSHGEGVAIGMTGAVLMAERMGILEDPALPERLTNLMSKFHLPVKFKDFSAEEIMKAMGTDKKRTKGSLKFVLPVRIGKVIQSEIPPDTLTEVINRLRD